jgi:hypothetical protein
MPRVKYISQRESRVTEPHTLSDHDGNILSRARRLVAEHKAQREAILERARNLVAEMGQK